MNDAPSALTAYAGELLLALNCLVLFCGGVIVHHLASLRRERRTQAEELGGQLARALTGLQKINSSVIAQTNELKERLGAMKPALDQAEQLMREGTSFTADFKAVRGELRQLDERVEALSRTAGEAAASQSATSGALGELNQQLGTMRQELVSVAHAQPVSAPLPELQQIQEQMSTLRQVVTASVQAQSASTTELRSDLSALAAEQSRTAQIARDSLAAELRQQEAKFRQLSDKFLAESAQLRTRLEGESSVLPVSPRRGASVDIAPAKAELDAEMRKEFRKLADRLDQLQRRMEEIIKL
ncbi:MAG: hypothetical protein EBS05_14440 [Proteobacteria bacterium]|nr:hypothetical protein [Pseudomonadota bacterium]